MIFNIHNPLCRLLALLSVAGLLASCDSDLPSEQPASAPLAIQLLEIREGRSSLLRIEDRQCDQVPWAEAEKLRNLVRLVITFSLPEPPPLTFLAGLTQIRQLHLINLPEKAALPDLPASLPQLELLHLSGPGLNDTLAGQMGRGTGLRYLIVTSPVLSDRGLEALGSLPNLESLYVDCPAVTDEALERLQRIRPKLHLHW